MPQKAHFVARSCFGSATICLKTASKLARFGLRRLANLGKSGFFWVQDFDVNSVNCNLLYRGVNFSDFAKSRWRSF
jgi:hypothetical protein